MKNRYFTAETIESKSKEFIQKIEKFRRNKSFRFSFDSSALFIIDMQRYFLDETSHAFIPSAPAVVPKIKNAAGKFRELNMPVILTRHINSVENAGMLKNWWKDIITRESELNEIIPELNLPGVFVLEKSQYDAFYNTPLEKNLRESGIESILITGVMTHLCCETTARSAFVKGFKVFFAVDGTATYNEDFHLASLMNLSNGFAVPVLLEELLF